MRYIRRFSGKTKVSDSGVLPSVFEEPDQGPISLHALPDDWTEEDINKYRADWGYETSLPGLLLIDDADLEQCGIAKPKASPAEGEKHSELHYDLGPLSPDDRLRLAEVVARHLKDRLLRPFERFKLK